MGLLDTVLGQQQSATGEHAGLMQSVIEMLGNRETGGLGGLVKSFETQGLGHIISSWIGTGQNHPISPDQVEQGLGTERVQQLADKSGLPVNETKSGLARILPNIIDKLTPNGQMPEGGGLVEKGLGMLKGGAF